MRRISLLAQKNAPLRLRSARARWRSRRRRRTSARRASRCRSPFKGEPLEIGFNPEFLRDGLESAESEELVLKLISPLRPGLIQSGDDGGFTYLVMPIRLNV